MSNRLADQTSPYLRQHADNPVDWWPWCDQALAVAREQDKPILLSIGYSACHWCHVMAHESFEDAASARLMNELFVNIKVDREERPDIDKIYQLAHQALNRRGGGWPLTMFLSPEDQVPFFAGTYFPKQPRYGMPGFVQVLQQVRAWWDRQRDQVRQQNASLAGFLDNFENAADSDVDLEETAIKAALARIDAGFDSRHGGHMGAPKFPHCPEMELLLDLGRPDPVDLTLRRMADGGIHDQIGGGFCRYSVDERWEIPHFEKMLYDNAQLLPLYAELHNPTRHDGFKAVTRDLIAWLGREMIGPDHGFYSALDADSQGEEGKFYVWERDEVRALLDDAEFAVTERHYGFDRPANFENRAWNPIVAAPLADVACDLAIEQAEAGAALATARAKLFAAREQRVHPGLDDKVLTAWNALMIGGLARTARRQESADVASLCDNALACLYHNAWRDGRLFAGASGNVAQLPAYLDDYALLLDALIECLQLRWRSRDLDWAIALADALLERFMDTHNGGFFFTAHDHEKLIQRPKPWFDEAMPAGNGVATRALLRLGHLLGETRYLDAAERTLHAGHSTMRETPQACASLLRALNDFLHPRTHVNLRLDQSPAETGWHKVLSEHPDRRRDVYTIPSTTESLPGALAGQHARDGGVAYVCRGTQCLPPMNSPAELLTALNAGRADES